MKNKITKKMLVISYIRQAGEKGRSFGEIQRFVVEKLNKMNYDQMAAYGGELTTAYRERATAAWEEYMAAKKALPEDTSWTSPLLQTARKKYLQEMDEIDHLRVSTPENPVWYVRKWRGYWCDQLCGYNGILYRFCKRVRRRYVYTGPRNDYSYENFYATWRRT